MQKLFFLAYNIESWTLHATNRRSYAIKKFFSAITGGYICSDNERKLFAFPIKLGGLSLITRLLWDKKYWISKLKRSNERPHWIYNFTKQKLSNQILII